MKKTIIILFFFVAVVQCALSQQLFSVNQKYLQKAVSKKCVTCTLSPVAFSKSLYQNMSGVFYKVMDGENITNYAYAGRVECCRAGGCDIDKGTNSSAGMEYFDYFVIFNLQYQVTKISIYNYQATHGQEICGAAWLKQFYGYNGQKSLHVGKEIDAISGATISTHSFTSDIQEVCNRVRLIK